MEELKVSVGDDLKAEAMAIAERLRQADGPAPEATGGGSRQRALPEELRAQFVRYRTLLIQRGIFDPMLLRFDTASAAQASNGEIAEELTKLAATL